MLKLREAIGEVANLVFIFDQQKSITNALSIVFLEAHYGACTYHVKMNINKKFKTDHCNVEYDLVANAYRIFDF